MNAVCDVCGVSLQGELVQTRSADEPATLVKCKCMNDQQIRKLLLDSHNYCMEIVPESDAIQQSVKSSTVPDFSPIAIELSKYETTDEYELNLGKHFTKEVYKRITNGLRTGYVEKGYNSYTCHNMVPVNGTLRMRACDLGFTEYVVKCHVGSVIQYTPTLSFSHSRETTLTKDIASFIAKKQFTYTTTVTQITIPCNKKWHLNARYYHVDDRYTVEIEYNYATHPTDKDLLDIIEYIHLRIHSPPEMMFFIDRSYRYEMKDKATVTRDIRIPPVGNYTYRIKVDGEHCWAIDCGSIWYMCRNNKSLTITGFVISEFINVFSNKPGVIRAEQMPNGELIFIDILAKPGKVLDISRKTDLYEDLSEHWNWFPDMVVRKDHSTYEDAMVDKLSSNYTCDGIIVINNRNRQTYRHKEVLTIDLLYEEGEFSAWSKETNELVVVQRSIVSTLKSGMVYECSVRLNDKDELELYDYKLRLDKEVANNLAIYNSISDILHSSDSRDLTLGREVSDTSFAVRKSLYGKAFNAVAGKGLIIDIGSGRLQSHTILSTSTCYKILIDPKLVIPKSFVENYIDISDYNEESRLAVVTKMNKNMGPTYAIFRGTAEMFFSREIIVRIAEKKIPVVYAFSMSFLRNVYNKLFKFNVKQIGCCYVYDDMSKEGILVDKGGVAMKAVDDITASVTFLPNKPFNEPIVRTKDFLGLNVRFCDQYHNLQVTDDTMQVVKHICLFSTF